MGRREESAARPDFTGSLSRHDTLGPDDLAVIARRRRPLNRPQVQNNHLEQHHRGVKGRTRPMRGFHQPNSAHRFCRAHDEVRNVVRPATKRKQDVPAARRPLASPGVRADGTVDGIGGRLQDVRPGAQLTSSHA
ncbi:DDE domain-containing protein [Azospirillum brasilense]|uniref:DDE domain-containing protein n=1 Tax=Azospirillum brasilense TaxID=192 RepID=A0A6L3AYI2_AZOBR|nr:DDE domain-containing protein [Azospirillum brasilense]